MSGSMSKADLVADLKDTLHDVATVFESETSDAAFERFLDSALPDFGIKRPLTRIGQVSLSSGVSQYALSTITDFSSYKSDQWGADRQLPKPWDPTYPGPRPRVYSVRDGNAGWSLVFDPAPTQLHIAALGSTFKFWYFAAHQIGVAAEDTTISTADRGLLILRAQVEALRELAIQQSSKPVRMNDGLTGMPRNSTPSALYQAFLDLFRETR